MDIELKQDFANRCEARPNTARKRQARKPNLQTTGVRKANARLSHPNHSVGDVCFACASASSQRLAQWSSGRITLNCYPASGFARPPPNPSRRGISEKGRKSRETLCCLQCFPVPGCRKVNSLTTTEVRKANARLFHPNYSVGGVRFACASAVFPATRSRVIRKDCNSYASGFARPPPNPSRRGISEKGRKSRETLCCLQCFPVPGCRKVNSLTTTEVRKANARLFHPNYSVGGVRFACASAVFPATRSRVIRKDCNSYASGFARPPPNPSRRGISEKGRKSRETLCCFQCFPVPGCRKVNSLTTTEVRKANARLFHPNYSVGGVRFACASAVFPATRSRVIRKDCNSYASGFARPPPNPSRRGISEKGRKSRETLCCFQCFPVPGCRKVNSLTTTEVRKANARLFHPNYSVGGVRFACASAVFPATRSRVIRKDCNSYASGFARPPPNPSRRGISEKGRKSRETLCCFQSFPVPECRKVNSLIKQRKCAKPMRVYFARTTQLEVSVLRARLLSSQRLAQG